MQSDYTGTIAVALAIAAGLSTIIGVPVPVPGSNLTFRTNDDEAERVVLDFYLCVFM